MAGEDEQTTFTAITVTRTYLSTDQGSVRFVLNADIFYEASPPAYTDWQPRVPVVAVLNGSGAISVVLPANNDPDTVPTGTYYVVTELIVGRPSKTYTVVVPYNASEGTVDLGDLETANYT